MKSQWIKYVRKIQQSKDSIQLQLLFSYYKQSRIADKLKTNAHICCIICCSCFFLYYHLERARGPSDGEEGYYSCNWLIELKPCIQGGDDQSQK